MGPYIQQVLLSSGAGAIFAALAIGLVLTYRSSGVINFAHGAIATYVAYTYTSLENSGDLPIPPIPNPFAPLEGLFGIEILDIPTFVSMGDGWNKWAALAGALVVAALLGLIFHFLVFRALRYQPPLTKVVASIGLMLALQSAVVIRFGGSRPPPIEPLLPDSVRYSTVDVFGTIVPWDRFVLLGIIMVLTAMLWVLFRYTRFGLHTRAAADHERHATLMGVSADRQAAFSWVLASVLAGFVGVLVAPTTSLTPVNFTLFIVPALGAALLASFTSFWVAALGAVAIAMGQNGLLYLEIDQPWFPNLNLDAVLPFVVIVASIVIRGQVLPERGAIEVGRLPHAYPSPWRPGLAAFWISAAAAVIVWAPFDYRIGMTNSMIGAILALSLVVVVGYVGQISLAQLAFTGIAAAALASFGTEAGVPFPISLVLAALAATVFGLVLALPALRVRGSSLAIVTLGSAIAIDQLIFRGDGWFRIEGNPNRQFDAPAIFGVEFGMRSPFPINGDELPTPAFGLFVLVVLVLACFAVMRLRQSRLGEQMLAVRANERAAAAVGVNVSAIKMAAFGIAAFGAGIAGALNGYKLESIKIGSFDVLANLVILAFAYLGGISTVTGALYAGTLFASGIGVVVGEEFIALGRYESYVAGVALVATAVLNPQGIDGFDRAQRARLRRWWRTRVRQEASG